MDHNAALARHMLQVPWAQYVDGWTWQGANAQQGLFARIAFHNRLRAAFDAGRQDAFLGVAGEVLSWGGVKGPDDPTDIWRVAQSVEAFAAGTELAQRIAIPAVAGTTKVLEMLSPARWPIYDARAVRALQTLSTCYRATHGILTHPRAITFPRPPDRAGEGYYNPMSHGLGFLRAARLLQTVAASLNATGSQPPIYTSATGGTTPSQWQVMHLEMALFMLGRKQ